MNNTTCPRDGFQRPTNQYLPCPNCGGQRYRFWLNSYLLPEEVKILRRALIIVLLVLLIVGSVLGAMYYFLGNQLTSL